MTKSSPSIWHLLHNVKSTVKILSNFVAFLENINFTRILNCEKAGWNCYEINEIIWENTCLLENPERSRHWRNVLHLTCQNQIIKMNRHTMYLSTDYGRPVKKLPSLQGRKSNPNPKFLGTAEAYFVFHIGPKFQISLIYAFIGCP